MKIVLNKDFGGFGLSKKAYEFLGKEWDGMRNDEKLIKCVEELGREANGLCADLQVIEIPDNSYYIIDDYDGFETIYYSKTEILKK